MRMDPFIPAVAKTVTITVSNTAATSALPTGGADLEYNNQGTSTVFVEVTGGGLVTTATVAASYPIPPGQCKIVGRPDGATQISTISAIAGQTFYVSAGVGN